VPADRHDDTAELAARLRMSIARMARFLRQQDQGELPQGLTSALATIVKLGPMTLGDVAARERIAPPSVTKAVEQLVARGLVTRGPDATDRRVVLVEATPAGRRFLEDNRARRNEWLAHQLEQLDAAEVGQLGALLDVLEHLVEVATSEDLVR
jgi:DNA-binding MarR family transcriptional regulator